MMNQKLLPLMKGAIKHVPGVKQLKPQKTVWAIDSKYCYTVWMRHLKKWSTQRTLLPKVLAELGPGASLGVGLAALLSGCESVHAFDVVKYWDKDRNLRIFNELIDLFKQRADIPNGEEYIKVRPEINNCSFPSEIISVFQIANALSKERLELIRNEIIDIENPNNKFIKCQIPWYESGILKRDSVDFIYSQAVLEHVEDLERTYKAMRDWLKPMGLMSHTIDLKAHGTSKMWNGHWTFSDFEWKIVKGGKSFLINRQPYSHHINLHAKYGFKVLSTSLVQKDNRLSKEKIAHRFKDLTNEELTTSGLYILSQKGKV